ncbi:MAG: DUF3880 domain-containing protein, partial [Polyangiales bacterium]
MNRLLIVGNDLQWELPASYARSFGRCGVDVTLFDYYGLQTRWGARASSRVLREVARSAARRVQAVHLVQAARDVRPDAIPFVKCDDLPTLTYAALRRAVAGVKLAVYHPDSPFNVRFVRGPSHRRGLAQMRAVDAYFIWSQALVARIEHAGARNVHYVGFAADETYCKPMVLDAEERARFGSDVSFCGTWDEKRERWLEPLCASHLDVGLFGPDSWVTRCKTEVVRRRYRGILPLGPDVARTVSGSRVTINLLRQQNEGAENMRTYEVPMCGGVMVAEHSDVQASLFRPGIEAFYATTPEALRDEAIRVASLPDDTLRAIGEAA